ncbi:probable serine/threonine-protein kinase DDB_G0283337 [Macrobrachium nipponense]|uniref:probable serine/threonine-protein kinase DDB_G0283337 n=1 Tax=Macrobrachium nipponense TaxID=159736 RepID=UPI0030C86CB7
MLGIELNGKIWHLYLTWAVLPSSALPILLANALFSAPFRDRLPPLYGLPLQKSIPQGIIDINHNSAENERDERFLNDREFGGSVSGGLAAVGKLAGGRDANLTDGAQGNLAEESNADFAGILSGRLAAMRERLQGSQNEKLNEKFIIQSVLQNVLAQALEEHTNRHDILKEVVRRGNYDVNTHKNFFVFSDQDKMKFVLNSFDSYSNDDDSVPPYVFKNSRIDGEQHNMTRIMVKDAVGLQKKMNKTSNIEDGDSVMSEKSPEVVNTHKKWLKSTDLKPPTVQQGRIEKKNHLQKDFRLLMRKRRDNKAIMYLPVGSTGTGQDNNCPDSVDSAAVSISQLVFLSLCLGIFTAVANVANNINNNNNNNNNNNDNNINSNNLNFAANANAGNQITIQIPPGRRRRRDSILSAISDRIQRQVQLAVGDIVTNGTQHQKSPVFFDLAQKNPIFFDLLQKNPVFFDLLQKNHIFSDLLSAKYK